MFRAALALMVSIGPALAHAEPCEKADAKIAKVAASKDGLVACFAACWAFDGTAWKPVDPKAAPPPAAESATEMKFGNDLADKSADGKFTTKVDGKKLMIVNVATQKNVATLNAWKTPMMDNGFGTNGFADNAVLVWLSNSPVSSQARIYDEGGKLMTKVGGGDTMEGVRKLDKGRWLFQQFEGNELYVYEVAKGKKVATISLGSKRVIKEGGRLGDALVSVQGDKIWAMQGEADSGAAMYDLATGKQTRAPLPLCKQ
jgi:hypothetical protein